jgi:ribosomal protein S18 acetylase RimI-like enzyme
MTPAGRKPENLDRIRNLNISSDLDQVADLIEMCFPISHDPDGQTYIREMRKAAREMRLFGWLSNLAEIGSSKSAGFVWEDSGEIIGNLSLIPFQHDGRRIHLIANVAVHPDHRQRGIARALTRHALAYLRRRGDPAAWLQVREDNDPAIRLYRSLGFSDQAVRTTWRIRPMDLERDPIKFSADLRVRMRSQQDWRQHQAWLAEAYPFKLRWNLPVDFNRFGPGLIQNLTNFLDGIRFRHWAFVEDHALQGVITWQKTRAFANNLWLAFSPETEAELLPDALASVFKRLARRHPLSIDYPKGRSDEALQSLGFEAFRTLIWMRCSFHEAKA